MLQWRPVPIRAAARPPSQVVGVVSKTSRTVSLNWRMLANPAANATSLNGRSVVSISIRAVVTLRASQRKRAGADLGLQKALELARGVPSRAASPVTPIRSTSPSEISRIARATTSPRVFHSGEPGDASGRQRLQARNPARWAAAAVG